MATKNRNHLTKRSRSAVSQGDLRSMKRLPTVGNVWKRFAEMQHNNKGAKNTSLLMDLAKELHGLWKQHDMPTSTAQVIHNKMNRKLKSLNKLSNARKKITMDTLMECDDVFDCSSNNKVFKCAEDRKYYFSQVNKAGGYCTPKTDNKVHPRFSQAAKAYSKVQPKALHEDFVEIVGSESDNASDSNYEVSESDNEFVPSEQKKRNISGPAVRMKGKTNQSIRQTTKCLQSLLDDDVLENVQVPSSSTIHRNYLKANDEYVSNETYPGSVLYYDMKNYPNLYGKKREMIAVLVDSKLIAFSELPNKKAKTISDFLLGLIEQNGLNISKICSDTEATNTGNRTGVFVRMKQKIPELTYEPCRLHLCDLILKHELNLLFPESTSSPDIPYNFVAEVKKDWTRHVENYQSRTDLNDIVNYDDLPKTEERRDDYRLLLDLVKAKRMKLQTNLPAKIKLVQTPPPICNSRWNSRAIYCLFAEIVGGYEDEAILLANEFIVNYWAPVWFNVHHSVDWSKLCEISDKTKNIMKKHNLLLKDENPFTNDGAERVFAYANLKIPRFRKLDYLEKDLIACLNKK